MILRGLEKILTLNRHFRSTWPMRPGFRKMLQLDISYYHTIYHRDITYPWRFEDIRSRNYNELYRKKLCVAIMTSLPVRSIGNLIILSSLPIMYLYSKFEGNRTIFAEITNMTLLVHFYIAQILPEPEIVRLSVYHIKNSPWFPLSKALTFIPIGSLVAKI